MSQRVYEQNGLLYLRESSNIVFTSPVDVAGQQQQGLSSVAECCVCV